MKKPSLYRPAIVERTWRHVQTGGRLTFPPAPYGGPLYVYLAEEWMAETWISGGKIPLKLASSFIAAEHKGVMTPDEVINSRTTIDLEEFKRIIDISGPSFNGEFVNCVFEKDGVETRIDGVINEYNEDAYLQCLSCELSESLCRRLEKRVCVQITDIERLKGVLDEQMGQISHAGRVTYFDDGGRGHFRKSQAAQWQAEYRLVWQREGSGEIWVDLPPGMASRVSLA